MNEIGFLAAVLVATISLVATVLQRRESKAQKKRADEAAASQKETAAVTILKDLSHELRIELDRTAEEAARRLKEERDRHAQMKVDFEDAEVRIATLVAEGRRMQQTNGRLVDRVFFLEDLCRRSGVVIPQEPGTQA